jgi:hypothetical protein
MGEEGREVGEGTGFDEEGEFGWVPRGWRRWWRWADRRRGKGRT